jgi:hypothetical protein
MKSNFFKLCVVFKKEMQEDISIKVWWEVSMGRYLPHIINSSLVCLHCTLLSQWYTALNTKEPTCSARGVVADV